jgi:signal transduction histidine kinase
MKSMLRNKFKKISELVLASNEILSLENRLYLATITIGIVVALVGIVMSLLLKSSLITITITISLFCLLLLLYYLVRFKKMYNSFTSPLIIISFIGISIMWIFDGGINSSDLEIAFIIFILALIIVPKNRRKYFLALFILLIIIIYLIQLYRPDLITGFASEKTRWTDNIVTAIYSSFFIFLIIRFLLRNYELEKERAEDNEVKLRKLNADKDLFISILAHDLRNPFNTLLGLSEMLLEDVHTQDAATTRKHIEIMNTISKTTYNLLEDLLLWAKSQSGKLDFKPTGIDFVKTCQKVVETMRIVAISKKITVNYAATSPIQILADEDMIKVVLRNLVSNGIKFTNSGGEINIITEQTPSFLTVTVSDNGVGIKPESLINLFDISKKVTTAGTSNEKGTGLGLMLCKEFIERHGGKIWVESVSGKGSDFKFTIPLAAY